MRDSRLAIACALLLAGCAKREPAPPSPPKGRVELSVRLCPTKDAAASDARSVTLSPDAPPKTPQLIQRGGVVLAVITVPKELDGPAAIELLKRTIGAMYPKADAMIVLGTHCLEDLQPAIEANLQHWWKLALVVGSNCGGPVRSPVGVTALVDASRPTPVRITFDRATRAILRVE